MPADDPSTSLSFEPPTSLLAHPSSVATPTPTPDGVTTTLSDVPTQAADTTTLQPSDTPVASAEPSTTAPAPSINDNPIAPSPLPVLANVEDAPQPTPTAAPFQAQEDQKVRLSAESPIPPHLDTTSVPSETWTASPDDSAVLSTSTADPADLEPQATGLDTFSTSGLVRTTYYATSTPTSTASYLSLMSSTTTSTPSKPATPMPTEKNQGVSSTTEASRRAAVAGTLLAIFVVLALVGCFLCMRCRFPSILRRMVEARSQELVEDQEKGSITSEKVLGSPSSKFDSSDGMILPVLPSDAPLSGSPLTQERWKYLATNDNGKYQDVTNVLVGGPYTEISLESNTDIHSSAGSVGGQSSEGHGENGSNRTSAGATSTTQSYSTCASRYSGQSNEVPQDMSSEDVDFLPNFLCAPPPVVKQGRARSKTVTNSTYGYPSNTPLVSSSKSFPAKLSLGSYRADSRLSAESGRSEVTKRSTGSEWDVAREYGRFSKESMGGSSILSAISEDPDHVEAVEVGKKNCLLVTGKF